MSRFIVDYNDKHNRTSNHLPTIRSLSFGILWLLLAAAGLMAQPRVATFADASARASAEGKLILILFPAPENALFGAMATILPPGELRHLRETRYVEFTAALPQEQALAVRYGINLTPAFVIAEPDGSEVDRLVGRQTPTEIKSVLENAAEGTSQIARLKAKAEGSQKIEDRGRLGDAYEKRGFLKEAHAAYLWCLEKGEAADPAGHRRSLKLLVQRMRAIERSEPTTRGAIAGYQDSVERRLSTASMDSYLIAFAVNEAMDEPNRNVTNFEKLPPNSELRCELFPYIFEGLVQARSYQAAAATIDLETFIGRLFPLHLVSEFPHGKEVQARHTHRIAPEARLRAISHTAAGVEAALGVDQFEKAKRLAGRVIDWSDSAEVRSALASAAQRAKGKHTDAFLQWLRNYPVETGGK